MPMLTTALALFLLFGLATTALAGPLDTPGYAKAVTCSACHGANGNSRSESMPILAGMNVAYFKKAIEDYAAGRRPSPEMEPFAKQVKLLGVDEIATFFAAQKREPSPGKPDRAAIERGRAASTACAACHGPEGQGDAPKLVPAIAGQPAGYIRNQLLLFKADKRSPGDPALTQLKSVLRSIPDETLADVAAYYSSLK
ncbi:MAG TPA: c-type cytochrome [Patescibacteria group bacterium]|nr:c-type cytochrome [Patescibacteria group bacterium]